MTQTTTTLPPLNVVIAMHGAPRVLIAALVAMIAPPNRSLAGQLSDLDARMRRDIGLPPAAAAPPMPDPRLMF